MLKRILKRKIVPFICFITICVSYVVAGCGGDRGPQEITRPTKETTAKATNGTRIPLTESKTEHTSAEQNTTIPEGTTASAETTVPEETTTSEETTASEKTATTETTKASKKEQRDLTGVHPVVYITSESPVESTEEYVNCTIRVEGTYEEYLLSDVGAQIQVYENSSEQESTTNPPYRIEFDEETSFLGLHEGESFKNWTLLNQDDGISANYLSLNMGQVCLGREYYCSDATMVKVYINDTYMGLYTACEEPEIQENRIAVKEAVTGEEDFDKFGYLMKLNCYEDFSGVNCFYLDTAQFTIKDFEGREIKEEGIPYSIRNDLISVEQQAYIGQYMQSVYELIYAATYEGIAYKFNRNYQLVKASSITPEEAIRNVVDIDSAVAIYILEELTANMNVGITDFYFALDFVKNSTYSKVTFIPPWNLSSSNFDVTEGYYAGIINENKGENEFDNTWLIMLMANDWFREEVAIRLQDIAKSGELEELLDEAKIYFHSFENEIGSAEIEKADKQIEFYRARYNWLLSEFSR